MLTSLRNNPHPPLCEHPNVYLDRQRDLVLIRCSKCDMVLHVVELNGKWPERKE